MKVNTLATLLPASTAAIRATHKLMPCGRRTTHPHHNHRHTKQPHRKSLSTSKSNSRKTARNAISNGLHRFELQWRRRDLVHVLTVTSSIGPLFSIPPLAHL